MLTKMSLESARILAEELNRRRVVVEVLPETPLERVVEAGREVVVRDEPKIINDAVESLEINTITTNQDDPNSHDNLIGDITDKVVTLMNRRLSLARNVINPLISDYANKIINYIGDRVPQSPEIKEVEFSEFHDNPIVRDVFSGYGYKDIEPLETIHGIQFNEDNNFYKSSLQTGSEYFDNHLKSLVEKHGEDWYKNLARRYFTDGEELTLVKPELSENYANAVDENLVTHMIARHMYNNEDVPKQFKTDEYETNLLRILGRTSQNLHNLWHYKDQLEKSQKVTDVIATEGNVINVYGPNYRKYLSMGGSPTAIMGHVRKPGRRLSIEQLLEQHASLESIFDQEVNGVLRRMRTEKYRLMQTGALQALISIVDGIPSEVYETIPSLLHQPVSPRELLIERGRNFINTPKMIDLDDVDSYAEDIILVGLLPELELHQFMKAMDKYLKPSVGVTALEPKQAAYYVVLEEVAKFFMSQTSLSGVK